MEHWDFKCRFYEVQAAYATWGVTSSTVLSYLVVGSLWSLTLTGDNDSKLQSLFVSIQQFLNSPHGWYSDGASLPRCPISVLIREQHVPSESSIYWTSLHRDGQGYITTTGRREIRVKCFSIQTPRNRASFQELKTNEKEQKEKKS